MAAFTIDNALFHIDRSLLFQLASILTLSTFPIVHCIQFKALEKPIDLLNSSDFYELAVNDGFVDKSLFIGDFIRRGAIVCRVLRPAGWGKTTNLNMLKRFLELEVDDQGEPLPKANRTNRLLFEGGTIPGKTTTRPLRRLKVAEQYNIMELQGLYPVISVSFERLIGRTYNEIKGKLKSSVADLYQQFGYLRPKLQHHDRKLFDRLQQRKSNITEVEQSVRFLSKLLQNRYGEEVYVLVDDYDRPLINLFASLTRSYRSSFENSSERDTFREVARSLEFQQTVRMFERFLGSGLKRNPYVEQALVTGTYYVNLAANSTTGLNNDLRYGFLRDVFLEHFGFTREELRLIVPGASSSFETELESWYGYNFNERVIFHPTTIRNFLANGGREFKRYRTDDDSLLDVILSTDTVQELLQRLTDGGRLVYANYSDGELDFEQPANGLTALLYAGCLNGSMIGFKKELLSVANLQEKNLLADRMTAWLRSRLNIPGTNFAAMFRKLSTFRIGEFKENLGKHLSLIPDNARTFLYSNAIMQCLIRLFEKYYTIQNSRHVDGKNALLMVSKPGTRNNNSIALCYDTVNTPNRLKYSADTRLQDIDKEWRRYCSAPYDYIKQSLELSLIFCGKQFASSYKINNC